MTRLVRALVLAAAVTQSGYAPNASSGTVYLGNTGVLNSIQGTSTTVLHGDASTGIPTFGAVVLTTDVSGVLPSANGGANGGTLRVTSDFALASTGTSATTVTGLSFTGAATTTYALDCVLRASALVATNGPRYTLTNSGTTTLMGAALYDSRPNATSIITTIATLVPAACTSACATADTIVYLHGFVSVNATGTVAMAVANSTSAVGGFTIKAGSECRYYLP